MISAVFPAEALKVRKPLRTSSSTTFDSAGS
jgi:hypothetical protein